MKTFEKFFPDLMPNVPGCPEVAAERALLRASQRFCELTFAWRATLEPITTVAGTDEYELGLPERTEFIRVEEANFNTREIEVSMPNARRGRCSGRDFVECMDGKTIVMHPVPAATGSLVLKVTLKPSDRAIGVEDFLFDQYSMVIAQGAEGLLKQHAQKQYSDATGPSVWQAFEGRCATIKMKLWRGNARNNARTTPNFF